MKVALNLVFLVPGETGGMEVYARELVRELAGRDEIELTCLINREAASAPGPWHEAGQTLTVPVHASSRLQWVLGEQLHVPRMADRAGVDLVHSLASTAPVRGRQARVVTVHDLNFLKVPDAHFGMRALGMRALVPAAVRSSDRVIADSRSTRDDLVSDLNVDRSRIDVVPLAAGSPAADSTPEDELRARLGLGGRDVIFSPGASRPHKNVEALITAVAGIPSGERPVIVVSGYETEYSASLCSFAASVGAPESLVVAGNLSAADMEGLYGLSSVMVMPSRYEGFGLPVVEAMMRGVPVIASNTSSLPEVAGDAALLVSPGSPEEIRAAIQRVIGNPEESSRLSSAGLARSADFSWQRTADLTIAAYERALSAS